MGATIDLNLLGLFNAVAKAGGVTAAAQALGLPKSTVSRGIATLEASLGVKLFHRTTRSFSLTTAGSAFLERAGPMVDGLEALSASVAEGSAEPSGRLKLTAPVDVGVTVLPALLTQFVARHPRVQVSLELTDRLTDLEGEGFDAALRASLRLKDSSLRARALVPLEFQLFAAPGYLARRPEPKELSELAGHDWVLVRGMRKLLPVKGIKPARLETDDVLFLREALCAGAGLGLLPTSLAQSALLEGRLTRVLPRWSVKAGHLYFVHPAGPLAPKVAALRDFVFEYLGVVRRG